jgi:hypothetical protein
MLDSAGRRCQASLKLSHMIARHLGQCRKFRAGTKRLFGNESKLTVRRRVARDRPDCASETPTSPKLGRDLSVSYTCVRGEQEVIGANETGNGSALGSCVQTFRGARVDCEAPYPFRVDGIPRARLAYAPVRGRLFEAKSLHTEAHKVSEQE